MSETFLTIDETAKVFRVHSNTVRNWIKDFFIPVYRSHYYGKIFIRVKDFDRLIKGKRNES